jgi:uncharacterized protein (UPF0548 family)
MFFVRRPSAGYLARLVADQDTCELTYAEPGATAGEMPPGYHHDRWKADLGRYDDARFARLADAIAHWQIQLGAGLSVFPAEPVRPGLTFALSFRLPAGWVAAAGRVVYVTSQPDRRGFAYGTLPGHPERGEEAFHLVRDDSRMLLEIVAFSRPQHPLARLGAPVARRLQAQTNRAYLAGMRAAAAGDRS